MGDKKDQAAGRVKEAAGDLLGNRDLEHEGTTQRVAGEIKEKVSDAVDKVKDAVSRD